MAGVEEVDAVVWVELVELVVEPLDELLPELELELELPEDGGV